MKTMIDLVNTDWNLLRRQKQTLLDILDTCEKTQLDEVVGVIHFLDNIQDQAAEQIGETKVFGKL